MTLRSKLGLRFCNPKTRVNGVGVIESTSQDQTSGREELQGIVLDAVLD